MRWTRRKSIFALATFIVLLLLKSRHQKDQKKEFSELFISDELLLPSEKPVKIDIDRHRIYHNFLRVAARGFQDNPALFYPGIRTSPYKEQIKNYPTHLNQKPDGKNLVNGIFSDDTFTPYPTVGKVPKIDEQGLNFLHKDIKEACVCIGSFSNGKFQTKWLGRNALSNQEFWSATKIIPILHFVSRLNKTVPHVDLNVLKIRGVDQHGILRSLTFYDLVRDMVSYEDKIATSNSLAGMFKRFSSQLQLENWLQSITGNKDLVFRGDYGEEAFIDHPEVINQKTGKVLMRSDPNEPNPNWTNNTLSAYDLTRMISMLGWHNYIPRQSRLPSVKWHNLESLIKAMGTDPARLTDLAINTLGIKNTLDSVVIISKIGHGTTILRKRTEAVYVALVQFVVHSSDKSDKQSKLLTFSMTLKGARALQPRNFNREVVELDARMATEVTEILHRVLNSELTT